MLFSANFELAIGLGVGLSGFFIIVLIVILVAVIMYRRNMDRHELRMKKYGTRRYIYSDTFGNFLFCFSIHLDGVLVAYEAHQGSIICLQGIELAMSHTGVRYSTTEPL